MAAGAAWAAGIANALQGLQTGMQQRQDKEQAKLVALTKLQGEEYGTLAQRDYNMPSPESRKAATEAYEKWQKSLNNLEKSLGGDKSVWGKIKQSLTGMIEQGVRGGGAPAGPQPAPQPTSMPNAASYEMAMEKQAELPRELATAQQEKSLYETQTGLATEKSVQEGKQEEAEAWKAVTNPVEQGGKTLTPWEAMQKYMHGAAKANPDSPEAPFQAGLDFIDHGVTAGYFKMTPEIQAAYDKLKEKTTKQVAPKYATGTVAQSLVDSGVGMKPLNQLTAQDWKQVSEFRQKQIAEKSAEMKRRLAVSAGAHDHRYQEFLAATHTDNAELLKDQTVAVQSENILTDPMRNQRMAPEDVEKIHTQWTNAVEDAATRQQNISAAFDRIYGKGGGERATPAPDDAKAWLKSHGFPAE